MWLRDTSKNTKLKANFFIIRDEEDSQQLVTSTRKVELMTLDSDSSRPSIAGRTLRLDKHILAQFAIRF